MHRAYWTKTSVSSATSCTDTPSPSTAYVVGYKVRQQMPYLSARRPLAHHRLCPFHTILKPDLSTPRLRSRSCFFG